MRGVQALALNATTVKGRIISVDYAVPKSQYDALQGIAPKAEGADAKGEEEEDEEEEEEKEEDEDEEEEEIEEDDEDGRSDAGSEAPSDDESMLDTDEEVEGDDGDEAAGAAAPAAKPTTAEASAAKKGRAGGDVGDGRTLFVRNVSFEADEEELEELYGWSQVCWEGDRPQMLMVEGPFSALVP